MIAFLTEQWRNCWRAVGLPKKHQSVAKPGSRAGLVDIVNWENGLEHAVVSDIGMRRATNQDAYTVVLANDEGAWRKRGHLFVVADGMGAHAAGELASEMAVSGIAHRYHKYKDLSAPEALHRAVLETNAEVHQRGQANTDFHNMGTTASALLLLPQGAVIAHVGDSRVYRLRSNVLEQLTFDHSLVWELRASGQLPEDSAYANSVPKNIITRSLGPNPTVLTDFEGPFPLRLGDTFLLCSDGLSGQVSDEEIGSILGSLPPEDAAQAFADLANLRGGPDNITAVVVQVNDDALATAKATNEPLTIQRQRVRGGVHPALWIVAAVCMLAAGSMAVLGNWRPALIAGSGGLIAILAAALQRLALLPRGITLGDARRLGKGPYVTVQCPVDNQFVERLAVVVEELREATQDGKWAVNLPAFDTYCTAATQAVASGEHKKALAEYVHAISFMMNELREQRRRDVRRRSSFDF
jgi:serine/threonine protein phosphatase PrpC